MPRPKALRTLLRLLIVLLLTTAVLAEPRWAIYAKQIGGEKVALRNRRMCAERFPPCSTFKVPNTLIALETGALKNLDELIGWDGADRGNPAWNKDHSLRTALPASAAWFFQAAARRVGEPAYRKYLKLFGYGNQDISGGVDRFWLSSSLRISPVEQVRFLERLQREELPVSKANQQAVKQLMWDEKAKIYGKTGSGELKNGESVGWYVGLCERNGCWWAFASCLVGRDPKQDKDGYPGLWSKARAVPWLDEHVKNLVCLSS